MTYFPRALWCKTSPNPRALEIQKKKKRKKKIALHLKPMVLYSVSVENLGAAK
jgi:hypothetical protein